MKSPAFLLILTAAFVAFSATTLNAADLHRKITAEFDPVAPASASYEDKYYDTTTSKWGAQVDFNAGGVISTGPELWTGTFTVKGPDSVEEDFRREDFYPGERHKLDATRLRWNLTRWEKPASMRGWYFKGGYSYLRVNSRANRFSELTGDEAPAGSSSDAVPVGIFKSPDDETDLITDIRHGVYGGFGNRWAYLDTRLTLTLGASATMNFKRAVTVDSTDPDARSDYDAIIEDLPETRMSVRPTPEANLTMGYSW
jgi:hypothetical protein